MITEDLMREMATANLLRIVPVSKDPIEALYGINWTAGDTSMDQMDIAKANIWLEPIYCLGRLALAAIFMEKYFPAVEISSAEVLEDYLANFMASIMSDPPLPSELHELLMYEEPHSVLAFKDGTQFDPLSVGLGMDIQHPRIESYPIWKQIGSSWLCSQALLEQNRHAKLELLEQAEEFCPNTTLVAENKAGAYMLLGDVDRAIQELDKAIERRPVARSLFGSYLLGNQNSYRLLTDKYPPLLVELLKQEVKDNEQRYIARARS